MGDLRRESYPLSTVGINFPSLPSLVPYERGAPRPLALSCPFSPSQTADYRTDARVKSLRPIKDDLPAPGYRV
ncbi:hypothetical protein AAC387_Pa09g1397 [Persea americana]